MSYLPVWFLMLLLPGTQTSTETITFTVYLSGSDIGKITATKKTLGNTVHYRVFSDVEYNSWLYDHQRTTDVTGVMVNGELAESHSMVTEYGDTEVDARTKRNGVSYTGTPHHGSPKTISGPIDFISIMLYFHEPEGISRIYSESHLDYCKVKPLGNGVYEYETPEGKINDYAYKNGKLVEVKIYRTLVNITIERSSP